MRHFLITVLLVAGCSSNNSNPAPASIADTAEAPAPGLGPVEFCGESFERDVTEIKCNDEELSNLAALTGFTELEKVTLNGCTQVTDLTPLKGLTTLKTKHNKKARIRGLLGHVTI